MKNEKRGKTPPKFLNTNFNKIKKVSQKYVQEDLNENSKAMIANTEFSREGQNMSSLLEKENQ